MNVNDHAVWLVKITANSVPSKLQTESWHSSRVDIQYKVGPYQLSMGEKQPL